MSTEIIREALALGSAIKTHNSLRLREAKNSCTRALAALDAAVKVPEAFYRIGIINKAFDLPEDRRAYTYQAQPNNIGAARLGCAAYSCREQFKPDSTDQGLTLLQCLQSAGFGVFELSGNKEE